jgi:hypothetical protein
MNGVDDRDWRHLGLVLTFFGPGCWMWQLDEIDAEGVAGTREQAIADAETAAVAHTDLP